MKYKKYTEEDIMFTEKDMQRIIEIYIINPDVYDYAYEHCEEYKKFSDNLPDKVKKNFKMARNGARMYNGANKLRAGLFHAGTFGLSYGVSKLLKIGQKSKADIIKEEVESENFKSIFREFNEHKIFHNK